MGYHAYNLWDVQQHWKILCCKITIHINLLSWQHFSYNLRHILKFPLSPIGNMEQTQYNKIYRIKTAFQVDFTLVTESIRYQVGPIRTKKEQYSISITQFHVKPILWCMLNKTLPSKFRVFCMEPWKRDQKYAFSTGFHLFHFENNWKDPWLIYW